MKKGGGDLVASREGERKGRLPVWLRRKFVVGPRAAEVRDLVKELGLNTVCDHANCPNMSECFDRRTATFMILGDRCTRGCNFCAVDSGSVPLGVREDEPEAVAEACRRLGLRHVVITSVTRDDLADGGAGHFARVCRAIRKELPGVLVEILVPDFQGSEESIELALEGRPDIFNHNIETVPRLYGEVRPEADYERSLFVLRYAKERSVAGGIALRTKSGVMVGLGESREELRAVMRDLREVDCDGLTVGQYLAPSKRHFPVARFVEPSEFGEIEAEARELGFVAVAAGPFVRSSYEAESLFKEK